MSKTTDLKDRSPLKRLADETGTAIALVDEESRQVAAMNNNSICRHLNPGDGFSPACARFCGLAFRMAVEAGQMIGYECHAGLECRAVAVKTSGRTLTAIIGRTFVKADNYRKATERAISGDWSAYSPSDLFENVLLTGSMEALDKAAKRVQQAVTRPDAAESAAAAEIRPQQPAPPNIPAPVTAVPPASKIADVKPEPAVLPQEPPGQISETAPAGSERRTAEARAWRSFFSSLLKTDYHQAADSILEFLGHHYHFGSLVWLEKRGDSFENAATFGEMKNRRVRLGIGPDDKRLLDAFRREMPLELGERPGALSSAARTMFMFPIGIGEVSAAIATLDPIKDDKTKHQIARICHSIAPQLEILRLRSEVAHGETLATAVRRFSESLKRMDGGDMWLDLTQASAEMLGAERASLLVYDERSRTLEIKAMIGTTTAPPAGAEIGGRASKIVFSRNEIVAVSDVTRTSLKPTPRDRRYKTGSFISCPIALSGRTIGVMNFTDRASGQAFDRGSLELFQAIAPQLAVAVDRALLKEKAGEFEQLSVTDPLTGMLNRRYIEERLLEEVKRSNRHGFPMSFMMLDVDNFKTYNDRFGHPAGDEALKLVGHVIRETLRGADVAARFGGEEFAILLPQTTGDEAAAIAERIRDNMEHTQFPHREVTVSIGIASCSADLCSSSNIISAADKALYEAKRRGRNKVLAFETMDMQTVRSKVR